jgi:hypothetical protein
VNEIGQEFRINKIIMLLIKKYQQTEQLLLIYVELSEHKKITTCDIGNQGSGLCKAHNCGGVKLVNGIPTFLS